LNSSKEDGYIVNVANKDTFKNITDEFDKFYGLKDFNSINKRSVRDARMELIRRQKK